VYDQAKPMSQPQLIEEFEPIDDFSIMPLDNEPLLDVVDHSITLDFHMGVLGNGAN
jgi:iron transport multicopper oxidase